MYCNREKKYVTQTDFRYLRLVLAKPPWLLEIEAAGIEGRDLGSGYGIAKIQ